MANLVSKLEKDWDMVLFDSPPLVAVTDATMVSKEIDQIVMVVKAGHTDKTAFSYSKLFAKCKCSVGWCDFKCSYKQK